MSTGIIKKTLFILIAGLLVITQCFAQSLGDAVVSLDFGAGTATHADALATGLTSYTYSANDFPSDGFYTIENTTAGAGSVWWSTTDHTGNAGGYMMVVNASVAKTDYFFKQTVTGLCSNTTYQFGAWVVNLLRSSDISPPDITFSIYTTGGTPIQSFDTGTIPRTNGGPVWVQEKFNFTLPAGTNDVVIVMTNNSNGGAPANDLALDDITFSPYGPSLASSFSSNATITSATACTDNSQPYTLTTSATAGYVLQWQYQNTSGVWADIAGATSSSYTFNSPTTAGTYNYRVVSATAANIASASCRIASNVVALTVNTTPVQVLQPLHRYVPVILYRLMLQAAQLLAGQGPMVLHQTCKIQLYQTLPL